MTFQLWSWDRIIHTLVDKHEHDQMGFTLQRRPTPFVKLFILSVSWQFITFYLWFIKEDRWMCKQFGFSNLVDKGSKLRVHKTFRRLLDVFWTSCVSSIYVLCPGGRNKSPLSRYLLRSKLTLCPGVFIFHFE